MSLTCPSLVKRGHLPATSSVVSSFRRENREERAAKPSDPSYLFEINAYMEMAASVHSHILDIAINNKKMGELLSASISVSG